MRFYGLIATAAIGCSGGEPDEIEPVIPDPTTEDSATTIDTAPEGTSIDAAYYTIGARFAYDPETAEHVQFAEDGEGLSPMELVVTLIDSSALLDFVITEENSCTVTIEVDSRRAIAAWVEPNGAWTGWDVPAGSPVRDLCQFYGLPADFTGDPGLHVSKWRYGVGIGPLDELVEDTLRERLSASAFDALQPFAVGAALSSNLVPPVTGTGDGFDDSGYGLGYAVDGNFEIVTDGVGNPEPIPKAEIDQEVGVARGYYEVNLGFYQPGTALAGEAL